MSDFKVLKLILIHFMQLAIGAMGTARTTYRYNSLAIINPLLHPQNNVPFLHNGVWWYGYFFPVYSQHYLELKIILNFNKACFPKFEF